MLENFLCEQLLSAYHVLVALAYVAYRKLTIILWGEWHNPQEGLLYGRNGPIREPGSVGLWISSQVPFPCPFCSVLLGSIIGVSLFGLECNKDSRGNDPVPRGPHRKARQLTRTVDKWLTYGLHDDKGRHQPLETWQMSQSEVLFGPVFRRPLGVETAPLRLTAILCFRLRAFGD